MELSSDSYQNEHFVVNTGITVNKRAKLRTSFDFELSFMFIAPSKLMHQVYDDGVGLTVTPENTLFLCHRKN